jgi:DNA-binding LacI/PurR family transcriptional regulator
LTSVRLPVPEMAQVMVERVMSRLADPSIATEEFIFQPTLVARDSVARYQASQR